MGSGIVAAGCGSSASILRADGRTETARIVRSDSGGLYLRQNGEVEEVTRLDRQVIEDIDHPGNVAMVIGAVLLAELGILMSSQDFRNELVHGPAGDASTAARPLTAMFGVPGTTLLGFGLYRYVSSKRAARAFELPSFSERPALPTANAPGGRPRATPDSPSTPPSPLSAHVEAPQPKSRIGFEEEQSLTHGIVAGTVQVQ